ncbi:MAG: NADH-quinone oxidoreductase subunit C [Woeseia sp.]|nr:NADH-quinone oxidoreductase subunit C [Woeseia sp.]|tara:strand:+ start:1033 stop:1737 length:705 start_codon:yes stop_codon:yes gene_type:complete
MTESYEALLARIDTRFGDQMAVLPTVCGELTFEVDKKNVRGIAEILKDDPEFAFEQLLDVCGVDYLTYGEAEWKTESATETGFSRGVEREPVILDESETFDPCRFAVVYHLLSVTKNYRLRLRVFAGESNPPIVQSLVPVWNSANWFEREVFDLFGVLFDGHPDLRRIMTDYGFIGHPFRKDFPLSGNVEVKYDPEKGRVAYQPVTIEERTLVPRVIRDDNRYSGALKESFNDD